MLNNYLSNDCVQGTPPRVLVQVKRKGVRLFLDEASATDRVEWSWPGADLAEPFIAVDSSFNGADRGRALLFLSK